MPKNINLDPQFRELAVKSINEENRSVELSFSSEEPYERWWGIEILDHSPNSVNLNRLANRAPVLFNHQRDVVVGVIEWAKVEGKKGKALIRFGNSAKAKEVWEDVKDDILSKVSVGYEVNDMVLESESDGVKTYRVTDWTPFEISIVSIPADDTVGVGRSKEFKLKQGEDMPKEQKEGETRSKEEIAQLQKRAQQDERKRVREIMAIGEKFGKRDLAEKAVEDGVNIDSFREQILNDLEKKSSQKKINTTDPSLGMNEKEIKRYSFANALRALANPNDRKAQEAAAYEYEVSAEAQKRSGIAAQGILVPFDVFKRDMTVTGSGSTMGSIIDTDMMGLIELLKNRSAVMGLAQLLPGLQGNVSFPKQLSSMEAKQLGETEETTDSEITFSDLVLSPKRYGGSGIYSKQLLHQSSIAIEELIRSDLLGDIALKIDADAVSKILNETGVNVVPLGDNGGKPTNGSIVDLETEVAAENADIGSLAYVINARTKGYLKKTPIAEGNPKMILDGNDLNGYPFHVSNQVPSNLTKGNGSNLSALIFGNFSDLLIAFWGGIDLIVDPYTHSKQGKISIVADQFADIGIRRAQSFAVINDAIVS